MSEQLGKESGRHLLPPAQADAVRAYAADTRSRADRLAAVLEDIADHGVPAVEDCLPWEELRDRHLARLAARRPAA